MYFVNLLAFYEMLLCYHVLTSFFVEEAHPALLNEDHWVLAAHVQLAKKLTKLTGYYAACCKVQVGFPSVMFHLELFCEGFCPVAGVWELFLQKLEIISHKCIIFIICCTKDQLQCAVFAMFMTTDNFSWLPLVCFFIFSCLWQFSWNLLLYTVT